ncbi:cell division protein FtsA [Chrysiogenes arsenatis]|uniref:cell division protein FtsA n=1 Tax=Chrysiogenes arsenatis TaxID=309797 RepID=UPI0003F57986
MPREIAENTNIIVGLDIGTTKVCVVIAQVRSDNSINVIGTGRAESKGIRKGVVVNIDLTVEAIRKAVNEAELMAGVTVRDVFVSIGGSHIKGTNSRGVIAIKNREVREEDVVRVIESAKAVDIPLDRQILHVLPQEYIVDGQDSIKKPMGMSGVRLEVEVHIVTASRSSVENLVKSCNRAGLNISGIVLSQLATSHSVLSSDEKDLGVAVIDIGGGTTDMAIFVEGSIWHTCNIPFGGINITNDITIALRTPQKDAENIKIKHGSAYTCDELSSEIVEVPGVGGRDPRRLSKYVLSQIIGPRANEIFSAVNKEIQNAGFEDLIASGIVITGGACKMEGSQKAASKVFGTEVRIGSPTNFGGLVDVVSDLEYATAVGLVLYAWSENSSFYAENTSKREEPSRPGQSVTGKLKKLFGEFF